MLQNRDGRLFKLGNQIRRRANVENVVKRKLLALKFFEVFIEIAIKSSLLVRIFAVTQTDHQWQRKRKGGVGLLLLIQESGNHPIVFGGPIEGLDRKALPKLQRRFAVVLAH